MSCLLPLAIWILVSGLDDLFIAVVSLLARKDRFPWPESADLDRSTERPIAIFVPLWREHHVIRQMLESNLASIRYTNYEVFVGVYPNDTLTADAVAEVAARFPRIQPVAVPHDGPTSKGDNLNSIYQAMLDFEARNHRRFDVVVTHDAEDLIHPESLRLINWFSREYQMIQIPVLGLGSSLREFTRGLYCDEFAEFQSKDIPVRQRLGGFLPGNGVGTGFERTALECLARTYGSIFEERCLTEDYENGFRVHALGFRQLFIPVALEGGGPVATRELFPASLRAAIRQRSRWVEGIALQGWELHGWSAPGRQIYWFWRDRKGLVGNLLSPAANLLFVCGLLGQGFGLAFPPWSIWLCRVTLCLSGVHLLMRILASGRIFGSRFAALVPLRMLWGNLVNCLATAAGVLHFFNARLHHRQLGWRKTEHRELARDASRAGKHRLGDLLVRVRSVSREVVEKAARRPPDGLRLGEYLVSIEQLSEENLYRALSVQAEIPLGLPLPREINRQATRNLPLAIVRHWKVLPYRVHLGRLHLVTPEPPSPQMSRELALFSDLDLCFRLVRPRDYRRLTRQYLRDAR